MPQTATVRLDAPAVEVSVNGQAVLMENAAGSTVAAPAFDAVPELRPHMGGHQRPPQRLQAIQHPHLERDQV